MPDGQVQWIDRDRGIVQVARGGREYQAPLAEVASSARVPGVRVHFDIVRDGGVEGAANVTLREGSRSNKRHRRFGDLTGARRPGAKAPSAAAQRLGVDVATQPMKVVRTWIETLAAGDVDDALALYSPDAAVHVAGTDHRGREQVRAFLADEAARGFIADAVEISGRSGSTGPLVFPSAAVRPPKPRPAPCSRSIAAGFTSNGIGSSQRSSRPSQSHRSSS